MAKDVFISYRRKIDGYDNVFAELIKGYLKEYGIDAFFDKHDMKNGNFEKVLKRNIKECSNFLLLLTKNVFEKRSTNDILREEIKYAVKQKKNVIAIMFDGYNPSTDLSDEDPEIAMFQTYDILTFNNIDRNHKEATIKSIIQRMKDEDGQPFNLAKIKPNNYYSKHQMTDEDFLWITTCIDVTQDLVNRTFCKMFDEELLKEKKQINILCVAVYDVNSYKKKFDLIQEYLREKVNKNITISVYGFCREYFLEKANKVFGENHFIDDNNDYKKATSDLIELNRDTLKDFDIIDFSLILKDLSDPEKVLKTMSEYLNKDVGVIYIMDLDDEFVTAFEDKDRYVDKFLEFALLDTAAGNRYTGRKIYTFLKRMTDNVYISNECITTANKKQKYKQKLFDSYFSYIKPEIKTLLLDNPDNDELRDADNWLNIHYSELESKFGSNEFYFRAGYIFGFGVFKDDDE